MMGVWFLALSLGNFIGGRVAGLFETFPLPQLFGAVFLTTAFSALVLALLGQADPQAHVRRPLIASPGDPPSALPSCPPRPHRALGARASACDSASCVLVTRGQDGVAKGAFSVDLSFRYPTRASGSPGARTPTAS